MKADLPVLLLLYSKHQNSTPYRVGALCTFTGWVSEWVNVPAFPGLEYCFVMLSIHYHFLSLSPLLCRGWKPEVPSLTFCQGPNAILVLPEECTCKRSGGQREPAKFLGHQLWQLTCGFSRCACFSKQTSYPVSSGSCDTRSGIGSFLPSEWWLWQCHLNAFTAQILTMTFQST